MQTGSQKGLKGAVGRSAREYEAALFARCRLLYAGRVPTVPDDPRLVRLFGYLAEFTALLTDTPARDRLLDFSHDCERRVCDRAPLDPYTLDPASEVVREDDLARKWGLSRSLDTGRLKSEWAAAKHLESSRPPLSRL